MHAFRKTPSPPFSPPSQPPVNATAFSPIIDAVCLSEVTNLTNPAPIPGESRPAFRPDSCPVHSLAHHVQSSCIHSLATLAALYYNTSDTGRHTAHRDVRNLFAGHRATAYGATPTQPRLQAKSISVALPTATQTPKPMFLVLPSLSSYTATETPILCFPCCFAPL